MEHDQEKSASAWSNEGPLNGDLCTMEGIDDKPTEVLKIMNSLITKNVNTINKRDTLKEDKYDLGVTASRFHKLTEKGMEYKTQLLKQSQTTASSPVFHKRTNIKKLITDRNNLDVVKTELVPLDR